MNSPTQISLVVPVYAGERTLPALIAEIEELTQPRVTPNGHHFVVSEVLLVHDCGPDRSDVTIASLAQQYGFVRAVWLSRNYGQHAATMAGMANATGDWVVTMDEDGQHDPASIPDMLDVGLEQSLQLVYAQPTNPAPHGFVRNFFSGAAKAISTRLLGNRTIGSFSSFRLIDG
ncbi:MAG: glycosyltransferase, partial [Alcaligenaceae bacterium]